jgi:hypothetical protein
MNIFVSNLRGGFGNKIFDLLILLYLQYINGGKIYIIINKTHHDLIHDKSIFDIFNKLKSEFIVIKYKEINNIQEKIDVKEQIILNCCKNINSINDFHIDKKYKYIFLSNIWCCYSFIYELYNNYPHKNLFSINEEIISKKILEITKEKYMIIHIRYGDKINLSLDGIKEYIIYSPKFYKYIIKKFIKKKIKIYIITDDINIVKKFILDDIQNDDIKILDIPWWDAFYCLTKSRYTVLSMSTFSFMATMLNKKLKKAYIVVRPDDPKLSNKIKVPEEDIIQYTNWIKFNNKKYILNYNKKLMKTMLEYRNSFQS